MRDTKPKLPSKEYKILKQRLLKATEGIIRPDPMLESVDFAFNTVFVDPEEEGYEFNELEIRDAFLEFMSGLMQGYTKCLVIINFNLHMILFRLHLMNKMMCLWIQEISLILRNLELQKMLLNH